jgi:hypothetical protein
MVNSIEHFEFSTHYKFFHFLIIFIPRLFITFALTKKTKKIEIEYTIHVFCKENRNITYTKVNGQKASYRQQLAQRIYFVRSAYSLGWQLA